MKWRTVALCWLALLAATPASAAPGDVVRVVAAPGRTCTGLAYDGTSIWVADHGVDQLIAIDPENGEVRQRLKSPGYRPAGLAHDGEQLWNVDVLEAKIYRIRPKDGLVTRTIPAPVELPRALAFDGSALWVSDDATKAIHRVDPTDGTTIAEVPFPGRSVDGLTHDGRYLWVADRLADQLYALHTPSGEVVATLPAPGKHATGLGFTGADLVNVDYQSDRVYLIKPDDTAHLIREAPRDAWVLLHHQVRNFGPDPLATLETYLALPRDLETQQLLVAPMFRPTPTSTVTDQWGQDSVRFQFSNLAAGEVADVQMKVKLKAWTVHWVIYPHKVQRLDSAPPDVRRRYTSDGPKYDLKNKVLQQALEQALGLAWRDHSRVVPADQRNPYWIARRLYRYVHEKMHYERVGGWDVAPKVLARGSGSCSEYSYVYIALCRAAGLPARYVGSLVVRRDDASYDDVYHRWVEVYLPPYGWVPVDPSRGDKPTEAERADSFGHIYHDFLITTHGGGGSSYLDWSYNHNERYTCRGRCKVDVESIAEWSPEEPVE